MPLANNCPVVPVPNGASAITLGKVLIASAGTSIVSTGPTVSVLGVATEDCEASGSASVAPAGSGAIVFVEVTASGIAIGDKLIPAASGQAAKTAGTATHKEFATALEASTAAGQLIKAVLSPGHITLA